VRLPLGFRIRQPARELIFLTPSGHAEFSAAALPEAPPHDDVLILQTMRSHDQWNTTIYSDNDRYRGIKNLRALILMNRDDMRARHIKPGDLVDITATARDGSRRFLTRYRAIDYDMPRGCAAGYMPEMNALIAASDYSHQSNQPLMKNIKVRVAPSPDT
jgi:anaerobic selenocysteine-containing dehydrogenase